jgi:nicotinate-nucleotide pyrophosphorylase (carboxylating)
MDALWISPAVERLVELALEEDLGRGDVTTELTVPAGTTGQARLESRQRAVLCGVELFAFVLRRAARQPVEVEFLCQDGAALEPGMTAARVRGQASDLLRGERTALNFVQRLSAVATHTRDFVAVAAAHGGTTQIVDTRKTTPGFRALEKYAVRTGGGRNHRADLGSGILIKDNHVVAAGGVRAAVERARAGAPHGLKVECEVKSLAELEEALSAGAELVLLDNMSLDDVREGAHRAHARGARVEVSGGITLERLAALCQAGVDIISSGALTHSVKAVDLALEFE